MSAAVRVLHLRASNFLGGPERQVLRYAGYTSGGEIETTLATIVGPQEGREFLAAARQRDLRVIELRAGRSGDAGALLALVRSLTRERFGLVCTHGYQADVMGVLAGRLAGVPVACFLRGWTGESLKVRFYEALDRALLPLASRIVCLSETQAADAGRRWGVGDKVRVVVNVVDDASNASVARGEARCALQARFGIPAHSPVVAAAGRLSPEKGMAEFVRAVPAIRARFPSVRFIVFGDGPLRSTLEGAASALGLADALQFAGFVKEWTALLPAIDVLVSPSLTEVMPNTVLEAMAAAVPVVATEVGSLREIAGPEGSVMLVPARDPAAIAGAVSALLEAPARAAELGRKGQRHVSEAFSPLRQALQLRELYRELIPALRALSGPRDDARLPEAARRDARAEGASA